jgi:hypothetical protein
LVSPDHRCENIFMALENFEDCGFVHRFKQHGILYINRRFGWFTLRAAHSQMQ